MKLQALKIFLLIFCCSFFFPSPAMAELKHYNDQSTMQMHFKRKYKRFKRPKEQIKQNNKTALYIIGIGLGLALGSFSFVVLSPIVFYIMNLTGVFVALLALAFIKI